LTPYGRKLGLIGDEAWAEFEQKQARMMALEKLLTMKKVDEAGLRSAGLESLTSVAGQTWAQLLKRPEVSIQPVLAAVREELKMLPVLARFVAGIDDSHPSDKNKDVAMVGHPDTVERAVFHNEARAVETEIKFAGYLDQQRKSIAKLKAAESVQIPAWLEYRIISGLSREMQEKLERVRPGTIGQASRIPGVTPAALSLVHVAIRIQGQTASKVQVARRTEEASLPG
jgi:tRNA uridine 5-carboxymethylaminomethyl modification enzyme